MTDVIVIFHFGLFLALLPLRVRNEKIFKKMKKTPGDIILHMCTKSYHYMMYGPWDMVRDREVDGWPDGQTDGWTDRKSDI